MAIYTFKFTLPLGIRTSSRRFKEDIFDMGESTSHLMNLRPVTFRYKQDHTDDQSLQYGLIAEEVAEVYPELVSYDENGKPYTVRYHLLNSMLLNELHKQNRRLEEQAQHIEELRTLVEKLLSSTALATTNN
jgi:hypothetical protein